MSSQSSTPNNNKDPSNQNDHDTLFSFVKDFQKEVISLRNRVTQLEKKQKLARRSRSRSRSQSPNGNGKDTSSQKQKRSRSRSNSKVICESLSESEMNQQKAQCRQTWIKDFTRPASRWEKALENSKDLQSRCEQKIPSLVKDKEKWNLSLATVGKSVECASLWKSTQWMPEREKQGGEIWYLSEDWEEATDGFFKWMKVHENLTAENLCDFIVEFAAVCCEIKTNSYVEEYEGSIQPTSIQSIAKALSLQEWLDVFIIWQSLCKHLPRTFYAVE